MGAPGLLRVPRWGLACGGRLLGPKGGDFALGCSAGVGAGGFETRPYVCLFETRWGRRAFCGFHGGVWLVVGGCWDRRGATSPWAVLLVRARAGLKPAPTSASSRRGGGRRASLRVPRWGLACGGRLVGPRGATSPWAVLLVRARAGLKPAPTSASSGRGAGGAGPPCGFHGGVWLVVGGCWDRRGATSPWAVLLVRARAGLKPAPTSASSGRGVGGSGLLAGSTVGFGLWWAVGGTEGGDFALGCSAGAGAGGFETRPYVCLFGTRRLGGVGPPCGFHGGVWLVVGGCWDRRGATSPWAVLLVRARAGLKPAPTSAFSGRGVGGPGLLAGSTVRIGLWWAVGGTEGGRLRLGLFCWCGRGRV